MCLQADNGEDNGWWTANYLSFWVSFMFLYILCIPHEVSLQIIVYTSGSTLSTMAAGDASQTTPVQITIFLHCVFLHKLGLYKFDSCKSLTCCMACINKINNSTSEFWIFSWNFPALRRLICCLCNVISCCSLW